MPSSILESPDPRGAVEDGDGRELEPLALAIPEALAGARLDQALARLLPEHSRSRLQAWIQEGRVTLDGRPCRGRDKVLGGEQVSVLVLAEQRGAWRPQPMELDIRFEDADLLVLNKPPGLVVHPAAGNPDGTLLNGLLAHDPELARLPRCGIVHRLDKDTSGLMVVARSPRAHTSLVAQLQARSVSREYLALVTGLPVAGATVDAPIGRHPTQRTRMAVVPGGRPAVTHYRVQERYRTHALLAVRLETGRTHQIRVHLAHVHFPILGDPVYGGRLRLPPGASPALALALRGFHRQALHAERLALLHPASGETLGWEAPMPADMQALVDLLREETA
jgi:23S rRNA pseudouridine1911/1915/1917 synthase